MVWGCRAFMCVTTPHLLSIGFAWRGPVGYSWQVALSLCPPGFRLGTSLG